MLVGERLCHLEAHNAITILRQSFAILKLLHILRISPTFSSPLLLSGDELLLSVIARITNIDLRLGDPSLLQASLPVSSGGLGLRNPSHPAPFAFLASADGASVLIQQRLPPHLSSSPYSDRETALSTWKLGLLEDTPLPPCSLRGRQKSWDQTRVEQLYLSLLSSCDNDVSRACLLAAASKHSGTWLNAPSVSSCGLRMCNETIRIAVSRVGAAICHPHGCEFCSREVNQLGHHGLLCRYSQGHLARHNAVNHVIHCSLAAAKIPSHLEASGLHCSDAKCFDGVTMTPWSGGKFLVWDPSCVDTFCESHKHKCASECGAAVAHAEGEKASKYSSLDRAYSCSAHCDWDLRFSWPQPYVLPEGPQPSFEDDHRRVFCIFISRISVAIQSGNAISALGSLGSTSWLGLFSSCCCCYCCNYHLLTWLGLSYYYYMNIIIVTCFILNIINDLSPWTKKLKKIN